MYCTYIYMYIYIYIHRYIDLDWKIEYKDAHTFIIYVCIHIMIPTIWFTTSKFQSFWIRLSQASWCSRSTWSSTYRLSLTRAMLMRSLSIHCNVPLGSTSIPQNPRSSSCWVRFPTFSVNRFPMGGYSETGGWNGAWPNGNVMGKNMIIRFI